MSTKLPRAQYGSSDRPIRIGNLEIPCYVLEDGTRVLTQYGFYKAIGRSGKPAKGRGSSFEKMAPFLDLQNLMPYIDNELIDSTKPIKFATEKGSPAWGFRAEILPRVCEVYLRARDDGKLLKSQEKFALACDIVMRGLAHVGIIALVDEATGYQEVRTRNALQKILEAFIAKELRPWVKTFPDEYYENLFRLRGWQYRPVSVARPKIVGRITNDIIYERLAPGVLDELKRITPRTESGELKHHYHRKLTGDVGAPKLREHISNILVIMKLSSNWRSFIGKLNRVLPKLNAPYEIPFDDETDDE